MKLLLVGNPGGTNVADSFLHAAKTLPVEATLIPATAAFRAHTLHRHVSWRLLGHKPPRLAEFSARVAKDTHAFQPTHLVATGLAPITAQTLRALAHVRRIAFLTDDPWNPEFTSKWFLEALPNYDVVYTTRRSNMSDLVRQGCRDVRYLPFGYDPRHFFREPRPRDVDVFFAGGAERKRVDYLAPLLLEKWQVELAGDRWDQYPETRAHYKGHFDAGQLRMHTAGARVNVCLVRSANRDGHVMRSFEIPACGGCMVAEDTDEHRAIFGAPEKAVLYFSSPEELRSRVERLLRDEPLQLRLAQAAHEIVTRQGHTYADRLTEMLA